METWKLILQAAALLFCAALHYLRFMHMYQLNSYQNMSYTKYLRDNPATYVGLLVMAPAAVMAAGLLTERWTVTLAGALLHALLNWPKKAKKPLVMTPRVWRMTAAALVITCALLLTVQLPAPYRAVAALAVLLQPLLVMLYALLLSPVEKLINRRYINDARRILDGLPRLRIIGITGSYGKTSMKYFLRELLSEQYNVYMTPGNFNTTLGVVRAIRGGLSPVHDIFLCEMGARHPGDIREICELVKPEMGVITYIGAQHLETFGSQQTITDTKLELARAVEESGTLFLNFSSPIVREQEYLGRRVSYSTYGTADFVASDITVSRSGSEFTVTAPGGASCRFSTRLLGDANVENLLGAIAVANTLGLPMERLAPAVRRIQSPPHRLELINAGDLAIIDDTYNSNPQGAKVAIDTLARFDGLRVLATPGLVELGEREEAENRALGAEAANSCDVLILVTNRRTKYIRSGALDAGFPPDSIFEVSDAAAAVAIARAFDDAQKTVLLLNDLTDNY